MAEARSLAIPLGQAPGGRQRRRWQADIGLLALPAIAFMLVFYLYPLVGLIGSSVQPTEGGAGLSLDQYASALNSRRIQATLQRTVRLSVIATLLTLLISYPIALFLVGASHRVRTAILIFTFVSLAASLLVRNFGWLVVLADAGPVNRLMMAIGITSAPVRLVYSEGAILVALVHYGLPFMILPIYGSLTRLSPSGWEAAQALGASPWTTLRTVVLPQTLPGISGGVTLTFAICASSYVTPLMLGSSSTAFASQIAADELLVQLNFPRASVIIVLLTALTFLVLGIYGLAVRRVGRSHV